ncbi:hypothetical protein Phum_PHUM086670 [Pediculus humanus corporis]|uniref:Uncharacterized protein n=1 Tax=Pediculus humanus subsp. corporis TaxID=121224 RepID=E0VCE9_PEDHC|nr:uncharacterized protein Phum_PHUM086670 [Pediculus humanus corporis]EEB11055.1 hypothetical protein Phum_PHUM086670 [Pediculus humanus corporis]
MNFEYVVKRNEKKKICFGSTLERKLLEDDTKGLTSKLAKTYLRENLPVAPGMYDHSNVTSSINPTSNLGTVLGGRKAERKTIFTGSLTPAPGEYNLPSMLPEKYIQVGTYNISASKHRTLNFKYSFGGKKCLFPIIKVKCAPYNFDECERCQKYPEGDYWYLEAIESKPILKPFCVVLVMK